MPEQQPGTPTPEGQWPKLDLSGRSAQEQQVAFMERLVDLSAQRSYMNAERTLSVWLRTALALMVLGVAIDRFRLFVLEDHQTHDVGAAASDWTGIAMVAIAVVMVVVLAVRYGLFASSYCRTYEVPPYHGPFLAPVFSALIAAFGVAIVVLLVLQS